MAFAMSLPFGAWIASRSAIGYRLSAIREASPARFRYGLSQERDAGSIGMAILGGRFPLEEHLVICRPLRVGIANAYIAGPTDITTKIREPLVHEKPC